MNLQIHCDNCGASVHVYALDSFTGFEPDCVRLYDGYPDIHSNYGRPAIFDAKLMHFCDWRCASGWTKTKAIEAQS